jgi:hypothetical protein
MDFSFSNINVFDDGCRDSMATIIGGDYFMVQLLNRVRKTYKKGQGNEAPALFVTRE